MTWRTWLTALMLAWPLQTAWAGTVFLNEADFLAAANPNVYEGFESYGNESCTGGGTSPSNVFTGDFFEVTSSPTAGGSSFLCVGTAAAGPHPTEGSAALIAGSNTGDPWILTFDLDKPVYAVSFWLTDAAERGAVYFRMRGMEDVLISSGGLSSGNRLFFGFIGPPPAFNQFSLVNTGSGDGWGIDEVRLSTVPVPISSIFSLLCAGLIGLRFVRRKDRV